jgi:hypothetical protein
LRGTGLGEGGQRESTKSTLDFVAD